MLRALWPDTVVSEAAVSQCVRRARVAIGDADRCARRIETVSRHGLRLAVPVTSVTRARAEAGSGGSFVGRRRELARLEGDFDAALAGRAREASDHVSSKMYSGCAHTMSRVAPRAP